MGGGESSKRRAATGGYLDANSGPPQSPPAPHRQPQLYQKSSRFQLQRRVAAPGVTPQAVVLPPPPPATAGHVKVNRHKLVRASPTLLAQLRQQAAVALPPAAPPRSSGAPQALPIDHSTAWVAPVAGSTPSLQPAPSSAPTASAPGFQGPRVLAAAKPAPGLAALQSAQPPVPRSNVWARPHQQPHPVLSATQQPAGRKPRPSIVHQKRHTWVRQPQGTFAAAAAAAAAAEPRGPGTAAVGRPADVIVPTAVGQPAHAAVPAATKQRVPAAVPAPHGTHSPRSTSNSSRKVVAVLASSADGQQQQRVLVYKKGGRRGSSLRRTSVKAAARGNLTWRNPAAAQALTAAGHARAAAALTATPAAATAPAGVPRQSTVMDRGVLDRSTVGGSTSRWHKYVRSTGAAGSGGAATGATAGKVVQSSVQQQPRGGSRRSSTATGSRAVAGGTLLRLGESVYKVLGKGRSRFSLQRQPSTPLLNMAHFSLPSALPGAVPRPGAQAAVMPARAADSNLRLSRYKLVSPALAAVAAARKQRLLAVKASSKATPAAAPVALKARGGVAKIASSSAAAGHKRRQRQHAAYSAGSSTKIVYCPLYCRSGKCERRRKGCPYKHDSTKRAVCPRWLHGRCELGPKCPLQHQRKAELMPVCQHFLLGRCTATPCPYLHVNLPASAPVCKRFLRGFCPSGAACPHKHYTLRMVQEERKLETTAGAGGGSAAIQGDRRQAGGGKKRAAAGRYFSADTGEQDWEQQSGKRARQEAEAAAVGTDAADTAQTTGGTRAGGAGDVLKPSVLLPDFIQLSR